MKIIDTLILSLCEFLGILTCHSHVLACIPVSYNMAVTALPGKARNERCESETYKRANHSTGFVQRTCGLGEIRFQT